MRNILALTRFARQLRLAAIIAAFALMLVTLAGVLLPGISSLKVVAGGLPHFWASAVAIVVVTLAVAGIAELVRMLHCVEQGQVFAPASTRHFRRFALLLLSSAIANILLPPLVQLSLALLAGDGRIMLGIDDESLLIVLVGALLFFVARLFDEAARLEEDSRSIV